MSFSAPLAEERAPRRALVTGFYDWRDLGDPPELNRCRENPSCRVLAGEGAGARGFRGPLATRLRAIAKDEGFTHVDFALLPVTWGSAARLDLTRYHVVIHLGLGVYDTFHQIKVERGAYNLRRGRDAAGLNRDEPIESNSAALLKAPTRVERGVEQVLKAQLPPPFRGVLAEAREANAYLCNETHYTSLNQLNSARRGRLREVYFLHIPHAEGGDDGPLSSALESMTRVLLSRRSP